MVSLSEYAKDFFKSRNIEELLPAESFLNEQTLLTKSVSAAAAFALRPLDDECLNEYEKQQAVTDLLVANSFLDVNIRQYQYLFRWKSFEVPDRSRPTHPERVREFERLRTAHLSSTKSSTVEMYHVLELTPQVSSKHFYSMNNKERRQETRRMLNDLDLIARSYQIALPDLDLRRLNQQELFGLYYRLLHLGQPWNQVPVLLDPTNPNRQLRRASVAWDNEGYCLRVGRRPVRVFTLQEFPDASEPNLLGNLLKIDCDMSIITTWQPKERLQMQTQLKRLQMLIINIERHGIGWRTAMRQDPSLVEVLRDAGVHDDLDEINELMAAIRRKHYTGMYAMTILLHGERVQDLEKPASELQREFRLPAAQLHEETGQFLFGNVLPIFFGTMPGNTRLGRLREQALRNDHHAELMTVWGCDTGHEGNDFANIYETRLGPLHRVAQRYSLVANTAVTGRTRSGKTAAQIDYIGSLQVHNPITRIYDVGRSYEPLANYFGGNVLRCSLEEWKQRANPFHGDVNDANFREFCYEFTRSLIELSKYTLNHEDVNQLHKKLAGLLNPELPKHLRRLRTLRQNLEGDMKEALTQWVEGGAYGHLFDHAEDNLILHDFQVFEFGGTNDMTHHTYLEALQLFLIYRDVQVLQNRNLLERMKHITFDECVTHWQHPRVHAYIKMLLQQMQKMNVSLSLLTQSPEDYGALKPFILQNCTSFMFFRNPQLSTQELRDFGLDDTRIDIFRGLARREFLFHGIGDRADIWKVLKLTLDPYRYWLSTTTPREVAQRERLVRETGNQDEALERLVATA